MIPDLPVGDSVVELSLDGYETVTETLTITDGQTANLDIVFGAINSDDDGLSDLIEVSGYYDPFGNIITSDPENTDTDGDGLSDGYEAGELITDSNGRTFYKARSDPTKFDSDGDGLDDFLEYEIGSDPLVADMDGDGLSDSFEWEIGTDLWYKDSDEDG